MIQPRPVAGQRAVDLSAPPSECFLYLEGRTIASPAFRIMLWCDGGWRHDANRAGLLRIFDDFRARWGGLICSALRRDDRLIALARSDIVAPRCAGEIGGRLAGWTEAPHFIETAPCLRFGEFGSIAYISIELPHHAPDLVEIADQIARIAGDTQLRCGLAGFGFFLPDYLESLVFALPMATKNAVTAIELTPHCAVGCIGPETPISGSGEHDRPGLVDIGWRTLIGPPFWDQLDDVAAIGRLPGIDVLRQGNAIAVTAGPVPVWGYEADEEQLQPYRLVAQHLRSVRVPGRIASRCLFGGDNGEPERAERVRAYMSRFDD